MKEKRDWPNQTAEYASNPERPNCRSFHEYLTSIFATISQNDAKKVTEEVVRCQPLKSFELEKRTLSGPGLVERQSSQVDGMWFSKSRPCSIISHAKLNFKFLELIFLFVSCWSSLPAARSSQWIILSADHTFVMTASFHSRITFYSTSTVLTTNANITQKKQLLARAFRDKQKAQNLKQKSDSLGCYLQSAAFRSLSSFCKCKIKQSCSGSMFSLSNCETTETSNSQSNIRWNVKRNDRAEKPKLQRQVSSVLPLNHKWQGTAKQAPVCVFKPKAGWIGPLKKTTSKLHENSKSLFCEFFLWSVVWEI